MTPETRLDVDVQVLVDGTWWAGTLEHRRQASDGRWEGFVRYSVGVGQTHIGWFDYDELRQVPASATLDDRAAGPQGPEPTHRPRA